MGTTVEGTEAPVLAEACCVTLADEAYSSAAEAVYGMVERAPEGMRGFRMRRQNDVSGVSGTGTVLEGVQFSTGVVVIHWLTPPPRGSISVFDSLDQFIAIHVAPHPDNHTEIVFDDGHRIRCGDGGIVEVDPSGNGVVARALS